MKQKREYDPPPSLACCPARIEPSQQAERVIEHYLAKALFLTVPAIRHNHRIIKGMAREKWKSIRNRSCRPAKPAS